MSTTYVTNSNFVHQPLQMKFGEKHRIHSFKICRIIISPSLSAQVTQNTSTNQLSGMFSVQTTIPSSASATQNMTTRLSTYLHNEPFYGEVLGGSQQKIDSPLQTARIHSGKLNTWDSMTKLNGPFIGLNRDVFTREPRCWETAGNCVERETRVSVTPVGRNAGKTWQEVSAVRNIPRECLFWKSCGLNEMCVCFYP